MPVFYPILCSCCSHYNPISHCTTKALENPGNLLTLLSSSKPWVPTANPWPSQRVQCALKPPPTHKPSRWLWYSFLFSTQYFALSVILSSYSPSLSAILEKLIKVFLNLIVCIQNSFLYFSSRGVEYFISRGWESSDSETKPIFLHQLPTVPFIPQMFPTSLFPSQGTFTAGNPEFPTSPCWGCEKPPKIPDLSTPNIPGMRGRWGRSSFGSLVYWKQIQKYRGTEILSALIPHIHSLPHIQLFITKTLIF